MSRDTCLTLFCVAGMGVGVANAGPTTDIAIDLTGMEIECPLFGDCFPDQVRDSQSNPFPAGPAQFIQAGQGYRLELSGIVNSSGPVALVLPSGSTLNEVIDIIDPGNSFLLTAYVRNPSGLLPDPVNSIWFQVFDGQIGDIDLSITLEGQITDQGVGIASVKDIDIPLGFLFGSLDFASGSADLSVWAPSAPQQSEWKFNGDLSAASASAAPGLRYLDDPAFGTILGGPGNEDNPDPTTPHNVTQAQSSFMTTTALGIPGPGGDEDTVYCTSPAYNQGTLDPDHRRGVGLCMFPALQPSFPGDYFAQYTMIWDIYIPSSTWYTDFPANTVERDYLVALMHGSHNNDGGADVFLRAAGGARLDFGGGSVPLAIGPDAWYRIAVSTDHYQARNSRVFVDGVFVGTVGSDWLYNATDPTPGQQTFTDGEAVSGTDWTNWGEFPSPWALSSGTAPGSQGPSPMGSTIGLFCDLDAGRSETVYVANLAFVDETMTDAAVGALGGPCAAGIFFKGCSPADLAAPLGVLDFFDVLAYLGLFDAMDPAADLAAPFGTFDFFDVLAFLGVFDAGCP